MSENKTYNIVFGGIGGQGVLKASEICGLAAMLAGYSVTKSEIHGMSQRGGSVESYVRFGSEIHSPLIPAGCAEYLVCFHEEEYPRLKPFLAEDGRDYVSYIEIAKKSIENPRTLNTFLVGVLSASLPIDVEFWMAALEQVFPEKIQELNKKVFLEGREVGTK